MSSLIFLGDICFGRDLNEVEGPYLSKKLDKFLEQYTVIANLENPLVEREDQNLDHLQFQGQSDKLKHFKFVDIWGLANNHINDLGSEGINSTVNILNKKRQRHFGFVKSSAHVELEDYNVFFVADMMNYKIADQSAHELLYLFDQKTVDYFLKNKATGKINVMYIHTGLLFCGPPSKKIRERLHYFADLGADVILTCHSHTKGPVETYGKTIIHYSLGDFLMDGKSYRRRKSKAIKLEILNGRLDVSQIELKNSNYKVCMSSGLKLNSKFSIFLWPKQIYYFIFNLVYKINLLHHILSTFIFILREKGVLRLINIVWVRRSEIFRFFQWLTSNQNSKSDNYDAIEKNRKKHNRKEL